MAAILSWLQCITTLRMMHRWSFRADDDILTFSNAVPWKEIYAFSFKMQLSAFQEVQLTTVEHCLRVSDNGNKPLPESIITWVHQWVNTLRSQQTWPLTIVEADTFSFSWIQDLYFDSKMHLKMLSGKWQPFCLGLNVLRSEPWWSRSVMPYGVWSTMEFMGHWVQWVYHHRLTLINSSSPGQNRHHFIEGMLKCIFLNKNIWISNKIWLECIPWGLIHSVSALVQMMAWRHPGEKPLSEPMLTQFTDAYRFKSQDIYAALGKDELIPAWMSSHRPSKTWDEIIYSFPNFNMLHHWNLGMDK